MSPSLQSDVEWKDGDRIAMIVPDSRVIRCCRQLRPCPSLLVVLEVHFRVHVGATNTEPEAIPSTKAHRLPCFSPYLDRLVLEATVKDNLTVVFGLCGNTINLLSITDLLPLGETRDQPVHWCH